MAATDTIEGFVGPDNAFWYHYDVGNDILYLRLRTARQTECYGDEQPDGTVLMRRMDNDQPVGVTIVNWWKHNGHGALPDSLIQISSAVEPWSTKLAA